MKRKTFFMISNFYKLNIHICLMEANANPIGIFQISHGMCEKKERYYEFMDYMCKNGYVCIINDHRGHGKSIKSKDDLGYFYENGDKGIVEDIYQISQMIKEKYKGLPLYLFGHSMGSLVVRAYIKKYSSFIDGLIVCGCPSYNKASKGGMVIIEGLMKIKDDHHRSNKLNDLVVGVFNEEWKDSNSTSSWLCSDEEVVKTFDEDEECGFVFTLNGFECLFKLMDAVYSKKDWNITNKELPILFISGEDDPCMISKEKLIESMNYLEFAGFEDVTYRVYHKLRHELINEKGKEIVYKDILKKVEEMKYKNRNN